MPPQPAFVPSLRNFLLALHLTIALLSAVRSQSIGSFFTAIYLNGAVVSSNQIACSGQGQDGFCCNNGYSCEWDDAGRVACCEAGVTCSGYAYGASAPSTAGSYQQPSAWAPTSSSTWAPSPQPPTTTVYQQDGKVVPIVPLTQATILSPYSAPVTTIVTPAAQAATTTFTVKEGATGSALDKVNGACPSGYKTFTAANVGMPIRTVGCNVLIDSAAGFGLIRGPDWMLLLWAFGVFCMKTLLM